MEEKRNFFSQWSYKRKHKKKENELKKELMLLE